MNIASAAYNSSNNTPGIVNRKIYLLLFLLVFLLYGNSILNEYSLDDEFVTYTNPGVQKGIKGIRDIFKTHYYKDKKFEFGYRPVTKASYAVEYSLFGQKPHISHFINIVLYWIASCLLLNLLALLFKGPPFLLPFLITVLFVSHPIHTEVVSSLKNREVIFSFIGSITAFICFYKYSTEKKSKFLLAGTIAYTFAVLAKEDSFVFLLLIPVSLLYFKQGSLKTHLLIIVCLVLSVIVYVYLSNIVAGGGAKKTFLYFENPLFLEPLLSKKLGTGIYTIYYYIKLLLIPQPLVCYYGFDHIPILELKSPIVAGILILILTLLYFLYREYKKRSIIAYGIILFFISISMFMNIAVPVTGIIGERYAFTASLGFCIALAGLLSRSLKANANPSGQKIKDLIKNNGKLFFVTTLLIIAYTVITLKRNPDWKDLYTLSQKDILKAPNSVQLLNIAGNAAQKKFFGSKPNDPFRQMYFQQTVDYYSRSIRLFPDQALIYNDLGITVAGGTGSYEQAIPYFLKAVQADSATSDYSYNLALAFQLTGNNKEAIHYFHKAIYSDPRHLRSYTAITDLYISKGMTDEGIQLIESGLRENENKAGLYHDLGKLYLSKKDTVNAYLLFEKSLDIEPGNSDLSNKVSEYYRKKAVTEKAGR